MIIESRDKDCRVLRSSVRGKTILLNLSPDHFVLLKEPTAGELADLLRRFRVEQAAWLRRLMTARHSDIEGAKRPKEDAIYGTAHYLYDRGASLRFFNYESLPSEAVAMLAPYPPVDGCGPFSRVAHLPLDVARRFVDTALGTTIDAMARVFSTVPRQQFVLPGELEQTFQDMADPRRFLDFLAFYCGHRYWPEGPVPDEESSHVPLLLMLFLHREGIVLFPVRSAQKQWAGLHIPESLYLTPKRRKLCLTTVDEVADVAKGYGGARDPRSRLMGVVRQILLRSTIDDVRDVSADLRHLLYDYETTNRKTEQTQRISTLTYKVMRNWSSKAGLNLDVQRNSEREGRDLFGWTVDPVKYPVPPGVKNYRPNKVIAQWAEDLQEAFANLNNLYVNDYKATVNCWLAYLLTLKIPPTGIEDVQRRPHIHPLRRNGQGFRQFVQALPISNDTKNDRIRQLAFLFKILIDVGQKKIENPIDYELDKFPNDEKRAVTPRMPLSREMLEYIKGFNKNNDYEFSRKLAWHDIEHRDPLTGKMKKVWWPGVAILTEMLLELPVRGFQARFLDAGLADELSVDHDAMNMLPNPSPLARTGRQQGVFYLAENKDGNPVLGLFINTNKTGLDARTGYQIPWCPASLATSLRRLMQWNLEHGNVSECPLIEKPSYTALKNPVVKAQLGKTFPIFRDPITNDGWPCQKKRLSAYWNALLRAVEVDLMGKGFKYRLTRDVVDENGETSYQSLYDVHTLRVSGITAMVEAGMPPELVQEVVGHASVVMTLYYNRVRAARLNEALSKLFEERQVLPEDLPELKTENLPDLLAFLVCTRTSEDAAGKLMAAANPSGFGNGSFNIFVDGICPGGECSTGGDNAGNRYLPVPRHRACPLCRYRLTGPMFLSGLVYNANRLMYELRQIAEDIKDLQRKADAVEEKGGNPAIIRNQIDGLYRRTEDVAVEWGAEVQYVEAARRMLNNYLAAAAGDRQLPALVSAESESVAIISRVESKPDFHLLQRIVEGVELLPGFRPDRAAITSHGDFLNRVLDHNDLDPFLLKLDGEERDAAARMLGAIIIDVVPEESVDLLADGRVRLADLDERLAAAVADVARQVAATKRVDVTKLAHARRDGQPPVGLVGHGPESTTEAA